MTGLLEAVLLQCQFVCEAWHWESDKENGYASNDRIGSLE